MVLDERFRPGLHSHQRSYPFVSSFFTLRQPCARALQAMRSEGGRAIFVGTVENKRMLSFRRGPRNTVGKKKRPIFKWWGGGANPECLKYKDSYPSGNVDIDWLGG